MRQIFISVALLISFSTANANDALVRFALEKVRNAQFEINAAENALTAALATEQNKPKTCRILTALYTYEDTGLNEQVAISNAKAKCKKDGTLANVCDNAKVDICW